MYLKFSPSWKAHSTASRGINRPYYSFKIVLHFWLAKITCIIHQNQLPLTKFGRIFPYWTDDINRAATSPDYSTVNRKTLGRGWVIQNGGPFYLFHRAEIGEILAKNMAQTTGRQLDGWQLLYGEYLQNWTTLLSPKPADKDALSKMNLTSMEVSMFTCKLVFKIMDISEGIICLSLLPRWITPSSISIILQMILSLIQ